MKRADVVFSGMRPTGRLHLGNYWGALKNWVGLQTQYPCFFSVVDWHMLTTGYGDTAKLQENCREMVLDWLAAGLDPAKCVIFRQSDVPEHSELTLMLGMVTPLSWLENNPTWKEQLQELAKTKHEQVTEGAAKAATAVAAKGTASAQQELRTYGFLGYPVLQTADILLYHGTKVPVGQDQLPHVELSREIARKFNHVFGEFFAEPQPLLTPTPKVPGLDSRKMSKSYNNSIEIYETEKSLEKKIKSAYTDPNRKSATDPGHPLPCAENPPGCSVYALHKLYAEENFYAKRGDECRAGQLGCGTCKKDLLAEMSGPFGEFRERRESFSPADVDAVLLDGAKKASAVARKTMEDIRRAMRLR
ncbi:MAG: tryptophan--tRNA ligase [Elusimicrobia bacterium CG11_big_fil_rev_8_21_14_0_20_64_6]|nr:MAG: tryptophan--tRNA ligase [Elusimicrobia bacterium CG11_big_fil_rev_8_21_14_0_20_64_6]